LGKLLTIAPRYTRAYLMNGEVSLLQKDTTQALQYFEQAIDIDKYDPDGWAARSIVRLQQGKYADAESDLSQAIRLSTHNAGNYINRALARYHQNNLRGAMGDYDMALKIDPNNFIGHYNRGLLRAQVGDDNRAIEDFDFVLKMEPGNMMALFNRGLLRAQTGDYRGAADDYSTVIDQYPNFDTGYYYRAEARKKMGDRKGASEDELVLMKRQLEQRNGTAGKSNADKKSTTEETKEEDEKTRKKSDKNMNNYRKIVIADDDDATQRYKSDYRGRVQNRNVVVKLEPMYALTYYEKMSDVKRAVHYHKYIDELNQSKKLPKPLQITNMEAPLTEEQVKYHFALIDAHTSDIVADDHDALKRFLRGLDFYLVQDFGNSINDFTQAILCDDTFFPAYFMRSLVRSKELEYKRAEATSTSDALSATSGSTGNTGNSENGNKQTDVKAIDYDLVKNDLDKVIQLAPDFVYAYYNRGNVLSMLKDYRGALADYDKAISLNKEFAEAYFNRGLTHIFLGNNKQGITDLSKAGELGIVNAYNIIKRFTYTPDEEPN
jgi:tetratricopeptide (TPR) repeat protein